MEFQVEYIQKRKSYFYNFYIEKEKKNLTLEKKKVFII